MKKLLIMILLSSPALADVSLKAFTDHDYGIEYQVGSGVIGVDLERGLPVFNIGGEKRTKDVDFLFYTGVGFREYANHSLVTNSSAVSAKGCEKGKGKGVKRQCKKGKKNKNKNKDKGNNNGSGGNGSGGSSSPVSGSSTLFFKDKEVFQKVGIRATIKAFKYMNPSVEVNLATPDMGITMDTNVQLGLVLRF